MEDPTLQNNDSENNHDNQNEEINNNTATTQSQGGGPNPTPIRERRELPRLKFLTRSDAGVELRIVSPSPPNEVSRDSQFGCVPGLLHLYSDDGTLVAVSGAENVKILNTENGECIATLPDCDLLAMTFSPQNNYLLTHRRIRPEAPFAAGDGNIVIWDIHTAERLAVFFQRNPLWPFIRWSSDELLSGKMVSTEVQFFVGKNWEKAVKAIRAPGITNFSFAPSQSPPTVAIFVPDKKGQPGYLRIYRYPKIGEPIVHRTVFRASEAEFFWNSTGTACLVATHTDVDKSGKSYYGERRLQFLSTDPQVEGNLAISDEGSVHDMRWSPDGSKCIVIHGYMPAQATLFDSKGKKLADFGKNARNLVRWSPCGRMVVLAGFGNLNGNFDVWDVKKLKRVGTGVAAYSATIDWSPDSHFLISGVLSPKIRIDNGFTVWRYDGTVVHKEGVHNLYHVQWRPALPRTYPLFNIKVAQALKTGVAGQQGGQGQQNQQGQLAVPAAQAPKPAIYTPPSMRGLAQAAPVEVAEDSKPRKYNTNTPQKQGGRGQQRQHNNSNTPQPSPVGYSPDNNAGKRGTPRRKKKAGNEGGGGGVAQQQQGSPDVSEQRSDSPRRQNNNSNNTNNNNKQRQPRSNSNNNSPQAKAKQAHHQQQQQQQQTQPQPQPASPQQQAPVTTSSPQQQHHDNSNNDEDSVDPSKKVKALQKKLRQITQLKDKQKRGEPLDGPQLAKVNSEQEVLRDLATWSKRAPNALSP